MVDVSLKIKVQQEGSTKPAAEDLKKLREETRLLDQEAKRAAREGAAKLREETRLLKEEARRAAKEGAEKLREETRLLREEAKAAAKDFEAFKTQLGTITVAAGLITAAVTAVFARGLQESIAFSDAIRTFGVISGAAAGDVQKVADEATRLGIATSKSPVEIAQLSVALAQAGFTALETADALGGIVFASEASGESLDTVGRIIGSAINQFELAASDSLRVADVLTAGANSAATSITGLGAGLATVGGVANQAGQDIEVTTAALGLLANAGIRNEAAGTALAAVLNRLRAPTGAASAALQELNIEVRDSENNFLSLEQLLPAFEQGLSGLDSASRDIALRDIFGEEGGRGFNALLQAGSEGLIAATDNIRSMEGVAQATSEALLADGLGGALQLIGGSADTTFKIFGDFVAGPAEGAIRFFNALLTLFNDLPNSLGLFGEILQTIVLGLTALTGVGAGVITFVAGLTLAIKTGTLALIADSIALAANTAAKLIAQAASIQLGVAATTQAAATTAATVATVAQVPAVGSLAAVYGTLTGALTNAAGAAIALQAALGPITLVAIAAAAAVAGIAIAVELNLRSIERAIERNATYAASLGAIFEAEGDLTGAKEAAEKALLDLLAAGDLTQEQYERELDLLDQRVGRLQEVNSLIGEQDEAEQLLANTIASLNELRDQDLNDLKQNLADKLISQEEYNLAVVERNLQANQEQITANQTLVNTLLNQIGQLTSQGTARATEQAEALRERIQGIEGEIAGLYSENADLRIEQERRTTEVILSEVDARKQAVELAAQTELVALEQALAAGLISTEEAAQRRLEIDRAGAEQRLIVLQETLTRLLQDEEANAEAIVGIRRDIGQEQIAIARATQQEARDAEKAAEEERQAAEKQRQEALKATQDQIQANTDTLVQSVDTEIAAQSQLIALEQERIGNLQEQLGSLSLQQELEGALSQGRIQGLEIARQERDERIQALGVLQQQAETDGERQRIATQIQALARQNLADLQAIQAEEQAALAASQEAARQELDINRQIALVEADISVLNAEQFALEQQKSQLQLQGQIALLNDKAAAGEITAQEQAQLGILQEQLGLQGQQVDRANESIDAARGIREQVEQEFGIREEILDAQQASQEAELVRAQLSTEQAAILATISGEGRTQAQLTTEIAAKLGISREQAAALASQMAEVSTKTESAAAAAEDLGGSIGEASSNTDQLVGRVTKGSKTFVDTVAAAKQLAEITRLAGENASKESLELAKQLVFGRQNAENLQRILEIREKTNRALIRDSDGLEKYLNGLKEEIARRQQINAEVERKLAFEAKIIPAIEQQQGILGAQNEIYSARANLLNIQVGILDKQIEQATERGASESEINRLQEEREQILKKQEEAQAKINRLKNEEAILDLELRLAQEKQEDGDQRRISLLEQQLEILRETSRVLATVDGGSLTTGSGARLTRAGGGEVEATPRSSGGPVYDVNEEGRESVWNPKTGQLQLLPEGRQKVAFGFDGYVLTAPATKELQQAGILPRRAGGAVDMMAAMGFGGIPSGIRSSAGSTPIQNNISLRQEEVIGALGATQQAMIAGMQQIMQALNRRPALSMGGGERLL